jgi:hypothetical protein
VKFRNLVAPKTNQFSHLLLKRGVFLMKLSKAVVLAAVLFSLPMLSSAQDATGRITGTITDPSSAVIPGVQVTVTNADTQVSRKATTSPDGYYQILALPIGNYKVTAEHDGFRTAVSEDHKLQINQDLRIDIRLEVGAASQTIEVGGEAAPVETINATLGQSVTSRPLVNMPLNGRNVLDLALLQPGVTESNDDNGGAGNFSIAGGRTDSVTYLLDGGLNNDLLDNSIIYNPNPDSIAEFRLLTSNYTAEYGRNGGGIISVVTKSGTNQIHGSAFEFLRNDAFNANTYFNNRDGLPRDVLKRNQYGGTIGGPIKKDRLFFFVAYQGQRQVEQQSQNEITTFTPAELNGDFSHASGGAPDPGVVCFLTGFNPDNSPCTDPQGNSPGIAASFFQPDPAKAKLGIIDPSRINSVAKAYIAAGLIPTSPTGLVSTQEGASDNQNELTVKLDYNLNAKDKISGSFGLFRNPTLNPFNFATVSGYADLTESRIYFLNLGYTRVFSPTLLNEFHAIFHRSNFTQDTPSTTLPTPNALGIGIHSDNPVGPTNLLFDSGLDIGFSENGPTRFVDNTYAYTDTVSWTRGKHNWKFGAGFSAFQDNTVFDFIINGEFDFNAGGGIGSQNDLADFLLGIPGSYFQAAAAPNNIRSKNTYAFGQDEWHVLRNLVLTLGLRYEYSTPKSDTEGRSFSIIPGAHSTVFPNAPTGLLFPGDAGAPRGSNFPDKNDFAPRIGFAWDPRGDGKTSLRGGIGVFYDILKGEDNLQFNGQPPFVGSAGLFFNPLDANPTTQLNYLTQPFQAAGVPDSFPSKRPPSNLDFAQAGFLPFGSNGFLFMVDPHLRTPYIYQYNLSLQHEVFRDTVMETSYVGSSSHKLTSLQDINPMILGTTDRVLNLAPGNSTCTEDAGLCSFSGLPEFRNVSYANYNSLQASLTRQVKKSKLGTAYFTFAYTYAHNLDNVSGFRQRNSTVPAYDPDHFYASSDSDIKHRISFSGGWDLPFDEAWTSGPKRLTKGWSLYPIVTWRSGFPFDIPARLPDRFDYLSPGTSGAGDPLLSNANIVGPTNVFDPRKVTTLDFAGTPTTGNFYFNPNSFSNAAFLADNFDPVNNPSQRSYGTLSRNFLRGPHQTNFDLAVAKTTPLIGERLKAEFRVEFFNILNHPEFANPDVNVNSDTFGQITTTGSFRSPAPRIIQLAARLTF